MSDMGGKGRAAVRMKRRTVQAGRYAVVGRVHGRSGWPTQTEEPSCANP